MVVKVLTRAVSFIEDRKIPALRPRLVSQGEKGQSILEFVFTLPVMVGMAMILTRINTAIQISLVDQQYGRAQALYINKNSPFYPPVNYQVDFSKAGINQMIVGISDNAAPAPPAKYVPQATVEFIGRNKRIRGPDAPKESPETRVRVRIRNTVTLCTQNLYVSSTGGTLSPITSSNMDSNPFKNSCGSPIPYEQ